MSADLAEDQSLGLIIQTGSSLPVTPASGNLMISPGLCEHMHIDK